MDVCSRRGKTPKCVHRRNVREGATSLVQCVASDECIFKDTVDNVIADLNVIKTK